jgi:SAM-dependent methyltransferase
MTGKLSGVNTLVPKSKPVLGLPEWHLRYLQQAEWTKQQRNYIFDRIVLNKAKKILDIGCGTGALEGELLRSTSATIIPLDNNLSTLLYSSKTLSAHWTCADAHHLPFPKHSIDICLCHYLLLWVKDPLAALIEMKRVTIPGGNILILAEPDYLHRIDYPPELVEVGQLQRQALIDQGANPDIGFSIGGLMDQAGIQIIKVGVSGGQWTKITGDEFEQLEWDVLESDLSPNIPQSKIASWKLIDKTAKSVGKRVLFTPVFYAIGKV